MTRPVCPFLDVPNSPVDEAAAIILPLPFERTVSYGGGTAGGPDAILRASCEVEEFDEETLVDFRADPRLHTLGPVEDTGQSVADYLAEVERVAAAHRGRFVLGLGGEHLVTYGLARGCVEDVSRLTIIQIDAHADLADELDGLRFSHGTVMRRLWDEGARVVQVGVRSLSRPEYDLASAGERIGTFYAHELERRWLEALDAVRVAAGPVYLSIDVDGLDPSVIPSTGTPQPGGLGWRQTLEIIRAVTSSAGDRLVGADVVELVPSPNPPGCDLTAARLAAKLLAYHRTA